MLSLLRQALRRTATTLQGGGNLRFNSSATTPSTPKIVFSGIQPTGIPHLGNYLGALREWAKLQDADKSSETTRIFSVVDLHAITVKQPPEQLRLWRKQMLASIMAVGVKPEKSLLFYQSSVPQHAELMWVLSCNASMGYLSRMTQWKSKMSLPDSASPFDTAPSSATSREATKLGLFAYPVLQAADILLYGTTHVPVGEDQSQHLEFTRELANGFNNVFSPQQPVFEVPQTILSPAKRVMSLRDPTKKMSKSDPNPKSRILITDERDEIHAKLKSALTDSMQGVSYGRELRPGVSNLIDLICYLDESISATPEEVAYDLKDLSMRALKEKAADTVDLALRDVRDRYKWIMGQGDGYLAEIEAKASEKARTMANKKMSMVKKAMGMD